MHDATGHWTNVIISPIKIRFFGINLRSLALVVNAMILVTMLDYRQNQFHGFYNLRPPKDFSYLIGRCNAVRRICNQPTNGSLHADQLAEEIAPVCKLSAGLDPMDVIEFCTGSGRPQLVSKTFTDYAGAEKKREYLVPNVVHYVYGYPIANHNMTFLMYMSLLSVHRFIRPRYIFIHGDALPHGDWWRRTTTEVDNIFFVNMTSKMPGVVFGKKLFKPEHFADILRLEIIHTCGGIYFDMDILALRSFDGLRNYSFTLGRDSSEGTPNLAIIGQPCPEFVLHWMDHYRDYDPKEWASHASHTPNRLATGKFAHLIHIEEDSISTPKYGDFNRMFSPGVLYNWTRQYSTHVWKRFRTVPSSPQEIKRLNSTLGQMMRYIYYGTINFVN